MSASRAVFWLATLSAGGRLVITLAAVFGLYQILDPEHAPGGLPVIALFDVSVVGGLACIFLGDLLKPILCGPADSSG